MKNILIVWVFVLVFCSNSFADLYIMSFEDLIKDSDIIVVGTLQSVSEDKNKGEGEILIEEVLSSNARTNKDAQLKSGNKLQLKWSEDFACVVGIHKRNENKKGIWFLNVADDGTVTSGHPQRFQSIDELSEIKNVLKKENFFETDNKVVNLAEKRNSLINTLLVILFSILFYYFLYRSRFKIK